MPPRPFDGSSGPRRRARNILYSERVPLHLVEHPLVHDALATLRDVATSPQTFRHMAMRISLLLAAEATRDVPTSTIQVESPLGPAPGRRVQEDVAPLLPGADLVLSAIDQPPEVQEWVNDACVAAGVPFVTGGMQVGLGMYYTVLPGRSSCLAFWRSAEVPTGAPTAPGAPVGRPERVNRGLGPVASLMGALIALEAVRYLTGFAPPVSAGKLWLVDFATGRSDVGYAWPRLPGCPVCGPDARAGARGMRAGAAAAPLPAAAGAR